MVGGLSVDSTSLTTELSLGEEDSHVRAGSSRSQKGQERDQPAEVYGDLASSGPGQGEGLEGEAGEGVMTGQDRWIQDHAEGHHILAGQDNEHFSPPRTDKDDGNSFKEAKQPSALTQHTMVSCYV